MLAADSEADKARGYPAQERQALEQTQRPGQLVENDLAHDERRQDPIVYGPLHPLNHARWKLPPFLDFPEQRVDVLSGGQRRGEDVRGGHRILDREIDADAAHR